VGLVIGGWSCISLVFGIGFALLGETNAKSNYFNQKYPKTKKPMTKP